MVSAQSDSQMSKNSMKNNGFGAIDQKQLVYASQTTLELQITLPATHLQSLRPSRQFSKALKCQKNQKTQWKTMVSAHSESKITKKSMKNYSFEGTDKKH